MPTHRNSAAETYRGVVAMRLRILKSHFRYEHALSEILFVIFFFVFSCRFRLVIRCTAVSKCDAGRKLMYCDVIKMAYGFAIKPFPFDFVK